MANLYNEYNKPMRFDGDIIITDPCYIMNDEEHVSDWEKCNYGYNMGALGIQNSLVAGTIYGDWSCTTYQDNPTLTSDYKVIGHFCADAGLVGVFLLDEVMKYNPKYKDITNATHAVTLIKDFHGEVSINIVHNIVYDEDEVRVVGIGNINFETRQTGL